jgi:hypothetical protein
MDCDDNTCTYLIDKYYNLGMYTTYKILDIIDNLMQSWDIEDIKDLEDMKIIYLYRDEFEGINKIMLQLTSINGSYIFIESLNKVNKMRRLKHLLWLLI